MALSPKNEIAMISGQMLKTEPALELLYFDLPGKGEAIRLACWHGGFALTDTRVSHDDFAKLKDSGELAFGQMPALNVTSTDSEGRFKQQLVQSAAIMRYIGKLTGLYPEDPLVAADVDALIDAENDLMTGYRVSKYQERFGFAGVLGGQDGEGTNMVREAIDKEVLPRHLGNLEKRAAVSTSGWIASTPEPTIADFILAGTLNTLHTRPIDGIRKEILSSYPSLSAFVEKFQALPSVISYYDANPSK